MCSRENKLSYKKKATKISNSNLNWFKKPRTQSKKMKHFSKVS